MRHFLGPGTAGAQRRCNLKKPFTEAPQNKGRSGAGLFETAVREMVGGDAEGLKPQLLAEAKAAGFSLCRITGPSLPKSHAPRLKAFIDQNRHGQMAWLADRLAWRADPAALWPKVRSIITLGETYTPQDDPLERLKARQTGVISAYAQNKDYHDLVKKRLKRLARWLVAESGCEVKVFVDTAPVPEKTLGQAAGLGWQGKHTNLVSQDLGNWFFIGVIYCTLDLPADAPETDHCGSCRRCLDICPTQAFPAPYQLDARRCISYLTIEHKGPVDPDLRPALGNRIYGCDDCLAVCPWNKFAKAAQEHRYAAREDLRAPALKTLAQLDDAGFRSLFSGSPIKRIGRDRFVRNVAYAIGNSAAPELRPVAQNLTEDADDTVAEAARWAAARLA